MARKPKYMICEICGKTFIKRSTHQVACSVQCGEEKRERRRLEKRIHKTGTPLIPDPPPEEIEERAAQERAAWSEHETRQRYAYSAAPLVIGGNRLATYEGRMGLNEPEDKDEDE